MTTRAAKVRPVKPPFRVPSMGEIRALPPNGYNAVSFFSGCGGSSLGYKMAGFKVLFASEFIPAAQETYRANHPGTILDTRDIRQVAVQEVLDEIYMQPGELDLMDGSPPCSSFSTAGSREAGWGQVKPYSDSKQRTDDLFFEYVRMLRGLRPKVFVAENVSGLVKGTAKGYFLEILAALKESGYEVACRVLDAQWLGVPQIRQRTIFVGVRSDLGLAPVHPKPLPYRYSVRDAIPIQGLGPVESDADISKFAIAKEWDKIRPGEQSDRYFSLVKPALDAPCPTVTSKTGGTAGVCHPTQRRKFSIAELRRICAFPDDFVLTGTYSQQWERLGRAVPPVMMFHIARTIRDEVLAKAKRG